MRRKMARTHADRTEKAMEFMRGTVYAAGMQGKKQAVLANGGGYGIIKENRRRCAVQGKEIAMTIVFLLAAVYCVIRAARHFMNKRPPMYIEKDPDITAGQIREWNRRMGYGMIFWTAFAVSMGAYVFFGHWAALIPVVIFAAGGFYYGMKASSVLRDKTGKYADEARKPGRGVARKKKHRKKK